MIKDIFRVLHESYQIGRVHARVFEDYKDIRIADIVNNTVIQAVIMLVFDRRSFQAAVAFTVIAGKDTCQEHVAQTACITWVVRRKRWIHGEVRSSTINRS